MKENVKFPLLRKLDFFLYFSETVLRCNHNLQTEHEILITSQEMPFSSRSLCSPSLENIETANEKERKSERERERGLEKGV